MDAFQLALQGKVMLMNEYFLVGSVLDTAVDGFIEILRGLCDNPENRPIEFIETEYIYSAVNSNGANVSLRARCNRNNAIGGVQNCHLRYLGHTDFKIDKEKKAMVRSYIDCLTSSNLNEYLQALGFSLDNELIMKGYLFHKGILKVVVTKAFTPVLHEPLQPITQSNFVEISCVVPVGQDVADEVKRFADLLKPYVRMDKMNTLREEVM